MELGGTQISIPIKPSSEDVYDLLRQRILDHVIAPATKLNIIQIAQELQVSQTPVREALRQLQGDNLVVAESNKGYTTTEDLDSQGVRDLFEFRLLLEPWAARAAAVNRLSNPGQVLLDEVDKFLKVKKFKKHQMIEHDEIFHRTIMAATQNQTVIQAYTQSHCHLHLFRMMENDWDWQTSVAEHKLIAEAIVDADPKGAEKQMRQHLQSAYLGFSKSIAGEERASSLGNLAYAPKIASRTTN